MGAHLSSGRQGTAYCSPHLLEPRVLERCTRSRVLDTHFKHVLASTRSVAMVHPLSQQIQRVCTRARNAASTSRFLPSGEKAGHFVRLAALCLAAVGLERHSCHKLMLGYCAQPLVLVHSPELWPAREQR